MRIVKQSPSGTRRDQPHDADMKVSFINHSGGVLYLVAAPFEIVLSAVDVAKIREILTLA